MLLGEHKRGSERKTGAQGADVRPLHHRLFALGGNFRLSLYFQVYEVSL